MRPTLKPEGPPEYLALWLNLGPTPVAEAMFSMPTARSIITAQRLGVYQSLLDEPASPDELAERLGLSREGSRLLLQSLATLEHVELDGERYRLEKRMRKWLDPKEDTYVGHFIDNCGDFWDWWTDLDEVVRTGKDLGLHDMQAGDPGWERYIRGQYDLAKLSAPEVAKALKLPDDPTSLLDVAGGHGWFSAALCHRYDGLQATIVDLPGSAAVGRKIVEENGMSDRVRHVEGDAFEADLGGPHDAALLFNLIHHFTPEDNVRLFRRIHDALKPGGKFAVLDLFMPPKQKRPDSAAFLGLFFFLTSAAGTYSPEQLRDWLGEAGFEEPRRVRIRRIPSQTLYEARKPS